MKILLAASGGGHLRQILDLERFWSKHDAVFATEDTALGRSVAQAQRVHFFAHFAFGQARVQSPVALIRAGFANLVDSWRIIRAEKPEVVISTGAGSAFFTVLFARLSGARVVVIESFARFHGPSLFGRLAHRLAWKKIVQSEALAIVWPDAAVCDPFLITDAPRPEKQAEAMVTVGTVMPFARLVNGVAGLQASGLLTEAVFAQVGEPFQAVEGMTCVVSLPFDEMRDRLDRAELLFTHGGTGSLVMGLRAGCRIVAMPRDPAHREHYDDHQFEIVEAFAARGLIQMAQSVEELPDALARAREMTVRRATTDYSQLIALLEGWFSPPALR